MIDSYNVLVRWMLGVALAFIIVSGLVVAQTCPPWTKSYNYSAVNKVEDMGFSIPTVAKKISHSLVVDYLGNSYVTGYSDGGASKLDYVTIKYDPSGNQLWVARYNGPANKNDKAYAITWNEMDNLVIVTGESDGNGTKADIATVCYDAITGIQQWVERYDGPAHKRDAGYAICTDGAFSVFVTGESDQGSPTGIDYITLAYDGNGGLQWSKTYNGPGNKTDKAYAICYATSSDCVFVTGQSDGGPAKSDYATVGYDVNNSGAPVCTFRYDNGLKKDDYAFAIAYDVLNQEIIVTGASDGGGTKFDFLTIGYYVDNNFTPPQVRQNWTARYNNDLAGGKNDVAYDVNVDGCDNIFVTGASEGSGTKYDYTTVKYDMGGIQQWISRYDGGIKKNDIARSVVGICDSNAVIVTGSSDQGPGRKLDYLTTRLRMDNGVLVWAGRYNGAGAKDDIAYNVAVYPFGGLCPVVTGTSFEGRAPKNDLTTIQSPLNAALPGPITTPAIAYSNNGEVDGELSLPTVFALQQNYPNPFNPTTTISFELAQPSLVTLKIYNMLGQEVATLLDHEEMGDGDQQTEFNASNFASGVYFYRLVAEGIPDAESGVAAKRFTEVKKMVLMK